MTYADKEKLGVWLNNAYLYIEPINSTTTSSIKEGVKIKENVKMKMPEIINYLYDEETGTTFIKWSDKTETTVKAENPEKADRFTGFMTAYAKKAAGNTSYINSLFDTWAIKKPIKDRLEEEKRMKQEAESKRIREKKKVKFEKYLIRKEALRMKREYEAKKLAKEKYGIPFDEE